MVKAQEAQNLLTCPLHTPVVVTRVIDQDKAFLRFIENHNLKPGESIEVEDRDAASDSVRIRGKHAQHITIGARAASKLLVIALSLLMLVPPPASAQSADPAEQDARQHRQRRALGNGGVNLDTWFERVERIAQLFQSIAPHVGALTAIAVVIGHEVEDLIRCAAR